jgi:hypothetical protein
MVAAPTAEGTVDVRIGDGWLEFFCVAPTTDPSVFEVTLPGFLYTRPVVLMPTGLPLLLEGISAMAVLRTRTV